MSLRTYLFLLASISTLSTFGQPTPDDKPEDSALPNHGFSVQAGGNAPILSLNYHQTLLHLRRRSDRAEKGSVELGVGLGYTPYFFDNGGNITAPHFLSINYGSRFIRAELGYGATNGRRGGWFEKAGYQPGMILGLRVTPTPRVAARLFVWTIFYKETTFIQDQQFQIIRRDSQHFRAFPGVSTIYRLSR